MMDLVVGPYAGKETGETALLRELFGSFCEGDVAVMDRYDCSLECGVGYSFNQASAALGARPLQVSGDGAD